jgi:superfamily II DNA/RNA helicase
MSLRIASCDRRSATNNWLSRAILVTMLASRFARTSSRSLSGTSLPIRRAFSTRHDVAPLAYILPHHRQNRITRKQPQRQYQYPGVQALSTCDLSQRHFSTSSSDNMVSRTSSSERGIFADPSITFESMGIQSPILLQRLSQLGITRPTSVQVAAFQVLSEKPPQNVTLGSETGSGKTLAYLLPILDDILTRKHHHHQQQQQQQHAENKDLGYVYARAMILVPNKELVQQVTRMAMTLSGGRACLVGGGVPLLEGFHDKDLQQQQQPVPPSKDIIRIALMPGGLKEPKDFPPFRKAVAGLDAPVDLVISTPAAIGELGLSPKNINMFADIATVVCDEADMLLDGGYIRPLEQVLLGFRRADRLDFEQHGIPKTQHVFVGATLPDMGLRSVEAYLQKKFPNATRVTMDGMHNARHYGLSQPTVWIELQSKKERLAYFQNLLSDELKGQKVMLFVNSVEDVDGVTAALEQSGIHALPYHAKMPLPERTQNLDRFRRFSLGVVDDDNNDDTTPILVCTDLASRGVDIPGVNAIVQLQFAGNVVAHLHRMGRCGRAGQRTGRGIVFFNAKERELVAVVQKAEEQQETMTLEGHEVLELDEEDRPINPPGTVNNAFSRKRGFTKKRKKLRNAEDINVSANQEQYDE